MESPGGTPARRDSSLSSASHRSSTVRIKPKTHRSNSSLRPGPPRTPKPQASDEQSLTSFPSLSPSVENSPSTIDNILEQATPKVQLDSATVRAIPPTLAGLFTPSASQNGEPALFDDTVRNIRDVPGTLHHQSDEHVEHLLAKTGAVALVKQLAQDLAQRDAEITLLQRKAEERESLLRKMLRECEVSNMDIENRLGELRKLRARDETQEFGGELRKAKDQGARPEASIRDRLIGHLVMNYSLGGIKHLGRKRDWTRMQQWCATDGLWSAYRRMLFPQSLSRVLAPRSREQQEDGKGFSVMVVVIN